MGKLSECLLKKLFNFDFTLINVLPACMCNMFIPDAQASQKRAPDALALEFYVGAGDQTEVLHRSANYC